MVALAELYEDGLGVKLDKNKAMKLYRTAADRGDAFGQNKVGAVLHSEEKFEEAFRYQALAADQGYAHAENNLGCCHRDGEGTEVDLGKAGYWFERAAAKGHSVEPARLDARAPKSLRRVARGMLRLRAGAALVGLVAAAFLSAPTFALWCLVFSSAKPAWRKDDAAAEGGMENDMNAML
ncbi:hypothetical protein JL721_5941 [Aureococcus anophagefferens]|nr:hypothetical protein JL721_5941 [Aureococcus anophagefferens]